MNKYRFFGCKSTDYFELCKRLQNIFLLKCIFLFFWHYRHFFTLFDSNSLFLQTNTFLTSKYFIWWYYSENWFSFSWFFFHTMPVRQTESIQPKLMKSHCMWFQPFIRLTGPVLQRFSEQWMTAISKPSVWKIIICLVISPCS